MNDAMIEFCELGSLHSYKYSVILAKYRGEWLLCRHRERNTWEFAGGHVEAGESPLEAACRELWEETGAKEYTIRPLFDYRAGGGNYDENISGGMVFFAEVTELTALPASEMAQVRAFAELPKNLTYPQFQGAMAQRLMMHPELMTEYGSIMGCYQACLPVGMTVETAAERDYPDVVDIRRTNPAYQAIEGSGEATLESVAEEARELPPGTAVEQKHYAILRKDGAPAAVFDLIEGYPDEHTAFLGLFMVHGAFRHQGTGAALMASFWQSLSFTPLRKVRLAVIENNRTGLDFWVRQGFAEVGRNVSRSGDCEWNVIVMEREV